MKQTSKEALLNEYKGNLFEFLVSKELAVIAKLENTFIQKIPSSFYDILSQQESFLRNNFSELLYFLPELAKTCAVEITKKIPNKKIIDIDVVGMITAAIKDDKYSETDLVLKLDTGERFISLKLSRHGSFTNTKSAGARSFLSRYFTDINASEMQENFNQLYDMAFNTMAVKMFAELDFPYTEGFKGWEKYSDYALPGELPDNLKVHLYEFYQKMNEELASYIQELFRIDSKEFTRNLFSLLGFSNPNIIQVMASYQKVGSGLVCKKIKIMNYNDIIINENSISFELKNSSFDIKMPGLTLQVRLKPMNKFTHKSYKVNCAVKFYKT